MLFAISRLSDLFDLCKRSATEWSRDDATRWSASVAFYTLLSAAPLLVLTASVAAFVYGKKDAQGQLELGLRNLVGPDVAPAIQIRNADSVVWSIVSVDRAA
jgi:membrane protein